jgi:hypothetical protein
MFKKKKEIAFGFFCRILYAESSSVEPIALTCAGTSGLRLINMVNSRGERPDSLRKDTDK